MRFKGLYFIILLTVIFIIFIVFPNIIIFRNTLKYKQFRIYSDIEINENIYNILNQVEQQISTSEIYDQALSYKIFISSNYKNYEFFCPTLKNAFAATYPIINNIFITKTDIEKNLVFRNAWEDNERSLASVISHEVTHKLIEKAIGSKANKKLAIWKKEGYCEYISGEKHLDIHAGINEIYTKSNSFSPTFNYLKYRLLVTYLLDIKGYTFHSLIETDFDIDLLVKELRNY